MKYANKNQRTPWGLIAVVAVIVIVAIVLAVVLLGPGNDADPTDGTTSKAEATTQVQQSSNDSTTSGVESTSDSTAAAVESTGDSTSAPAVSGDEVNVNIDAPSKQTDEQTGNEPAATTAPNEQNNQQDNEIEVPLENGEVDPAAVVTPYGTLKFPQEWVGFVGLGIDKNDPYTVSYYADLDSGKSQKLFAISFGGSEETAVGTVNVNGSKVPVHVASVDFTPGADWTDREINIVFTMQECVNDILADLQLEIKQPEYNGTSSLPEDNGQEMLIDTPYGELHYPSRWKDYLSLDIGDTAVVFYSQVGSHGRQHIFTVHYGSSAGIEVGSAIDNAGNAVSISLEVIPFEPDDSWSDADKKIVAAMQEDLNYLLSKLG